MRVLTGLWHDLRFTIRNLEKERRFTLLAVLALALGIGSVTVIFSAFYGVILNTFPFPSADQVTSFTIRDVAHPRFARESLSMREFLYFRSHNQVFQDLSGEYGGFGSTPLRYTTRDGTYQFDADYLSANSFGLFGVRPVVGRLPDENDVKPGATPVFVIGYQLWQRQFNGDPGIVGRSFILNGTARTLVGIMPARFRWAWVDAWVPFSIDPAEALTNPDLKDRFLYTVGRLKPGVSLKAAAADLDAVAHQYARIQPQIYPKRFTVTAESLADRVVGGFRSLIYPVLAAVFLLLLIACSNVANLLLTRATARDREIAVRAALGAGRWRLIRQLLVESSVLAVAGCLAGCALAWIGIRALVPLVPYNALPQEAVIQLNQPVLLFAIGISILTVLLCGLAPALHAMRADLQPRLSTGGRGGAGNRRQGALRSALVIAEIGLSIALLTGAGLMMRTFVGLRGADLGFDPHHVLLTQLSYPPEVHYGVQETRALFRRVLDRIQSLPGVTAAAASSSVPPFGGPSSEIEVPGKVHSERWTARFDLCSQGYFDTLKLRLLRGRLLSAADVDSERRMVVVNQSFVRKFLGGADPIGQNVDFKAMEQPAASKPLFEIIGVVGDVRNRGVAQPPLPEAYIPYTTAGSVGGVILVRTAISPDSLIPAIRQRVWSVDPNLAVTDTRSLEESLQKYVYANSEFQLAGLGTFALIGLLLVVIGVYSVMAYMVSLETREIGIRMALGAQRRHVLAMMIRRGLYLIGAGAAIGLFAGFGLARLIAHQLTGVKPTDPWTYAGAVVVVLGAGMAACLLPARRATEVDPSVALRCE
jgi:putative ABC transport system permease protein